MKVGTLSRSLLAACVAMMIGAGALTFFLRPEWVNSVAKALVDVSRYAGGLSWAVFMSTQMLVIVSGILPAAALGVGAGVVYGVWLGFALAAIGTLAGAALAFILARSVFRPLVLGIMERKPRLARLDEALAKDGWRTVCLLRISPIMPFASASYALGLSSVGFSSYLLGTLGALPALFGYVVLGALAGESLDAWSGGANNVHLLLLVLGMAATAFLVLHVGRLAKAAGVFGKTGLVETDLPDIRKPQ